MENISPSLKFAQFYVFAAQIDDFRFFFALEIPIHKIFSNRYKSNPKVAKMFLKLGMSSGRVFTTYLLPWSLLSFRFLPLNLMIFDAFVFANFQPQIIALNRYETQSKVAKKPL